MGHAPPLSLPKKPYNAETIQIPTPKPYVYCCSLKDASNETSRGSPRGFAPSPPVQKRQNISVTPPGGSRGAFPTPFNS